MLCCHCYSDKYAVFQKNMFVLVIWLSRKMRSFKLSNYMCVSKKVCNIWQ